MKQIIRILIKDTRHLWPEILANLLVTVAFTWTYPLEWLSLNDPRYAPGVARFDVHQLQILATTFAVLLPFSWFFLIARVVHMENLIGQRQFWLTRPYDWRKLLAEKLLFVAMFAGIPFATAQMVMLYRAGFSPLHHLPGVAFLLSMIVCALIIPTMAFATTVSTVLRMVLVFLGFCAVIAVIAFLASSIDSSPSLYLPTSDRVTIPTLLAVCFAALVAQYSGRSLWLGRALLLSLIPTVALIAFNPLESLMFDHIYPSLRSEEAPIHAELATASDSDQTGINAHTENAKRINLFIPIRVTGILPNQLVDPDDVSVSIDSTDGSHTSSTWQPVYNSHLQAHEATQELKISMEKAAYEHARQRPVNLRVRIAFTVLRSARSSTVSLNVKDDMAIYDFGLCHFDEGEYSGAGLSCRYALHEPYTTKVTVPLSDRPCSEPYSEENYKVESFDWVGSPEQDAADFGFTPVLSGNVSFHGTSNFTNEKQPTRYACAGIPMTFTRFEVIRRFRTEFTLQNVVLPAVAADGFGAIQGR